jgi:hypothetical protein
MAGEVTQALGRVQKIVSWIPDIVQLELNFAFDCDCALVFFALEGSTLDFKRYCVSVGVSVLHKHHDQETSWGGKRLFSLHFHITVHHQGSQDWNSSRSGSRK